ncbi:riboflavin synthase [Candidatus Nitrosotalea okcheonensis]|uniref:Riboflavin synthase n=1 Tax=Candidatus Nitrosotalea okcheonensis TaxID=1903276 RepID=A0A2H1FGP1_9ARCH|nr:riboflavin synthase [Candidatus Nitrosotalea okcheonensis]MDE1727969.1 riboflavin synthase [Nitrososphaerota archaeon]MDE1830957.1 riboflavin synthase [Nitrososphaerota archaeon]MDE1877807.1 riboflavin synthase [Nitrososphaerota archaeon]SMH71935.1 Riboflavin synthase [Candidatus Nitrosotalea okcheonensis]
MFTGIIEGLGNIVMFDKKTSNRSAAKMKIKLGKIAKGLKVGDSVAVNGVCLTAINISKGITEFEMISETIKKTSLGSLIRGDKVNIERSLKVGERLEGHFVLGHVDGVGTIFKIKKQTHQVQIWIKIPQELSKYIIKKGSITVDGISLTVTDTLKNYFSVSIIPHTMQITNLNYKNIGDKVNIETDILGKYILSEG